jgi:WD40 repeat protein
VLLPLAYAEAPGLTPDLWAVSLQALTSTLVTREDVAGFAAGAAANFLIQTSDATASNRLFHQALNDTLTATRPTVQDQQTITYAFLDDARIRGWDHVPAYLLRSLAHHAAAGGSIDHLLTEGQYLLRADLARLIPLSGGTRTERSSMIARLLRRTPQAMPAGPAERLAMFQTTELLDHLATGFTDLDAPTPPYRPLWAHVPPGHELVALTGHSHFVNAVCVVRVGERDLLASGSEDGTVRLWDPASGQPVATLERAYRRGVRGLCGPGRGA